MGFKRDLFTGKLKKTKTETEGRTILFREKVDYEPRRTGSPWGTPWVGRSMGVHPEQVAQFNEDAKRHGTGAHYRPDGYPIFDSRGARAREMARRNMYDKDAGYSDHAGHNV